MNIFDKFKLWLRGEAGYSIANRPNVTSHVLSCSIEKIDQGLDRFDQRLNERFNLSELDTNASASAKEIDDLVESVHKCILDYSPVAVANTVIVETRPLAEILNDVSPEDGSLLIKDSVIIDVNTVLHNALCSSLDIGLLLKDGNLELLKIFPRNTITKILRCFKLRQIGQPLKIEIRDETYDVLIDEFVKDGVCYRKIRILDLFKYSQKM